MLFRILRALVALGVLGLGVACAAANHPAPSPTPGVSVSALQVFVEPDAGMQPVVKLLNAAQKTIRMQMYLLTEREIIDALKSARGRGVDVRVMLEAHPLGNGSGNKLAQSDLQAANITVKTTNPAYRLTHSKMIATDDRSALILTLNMTRAAFTTSREYGILDTNPDDVAEIIGVFEADWKRLAPAVSSPNLVWSPINSRERLGELIDRAQKTLDLQTEEMADRDTLERLITAAKRGVSVRVVMSPAQSDPDPNTPGRNRLKRGGVQVRLIKTPFVHAKLVIADNARAFVGSQNFSVAALDFNRELGIILTDAQVIQTLAATFAADWNVAK